MRHPETGGVQAVSEAALAFHALKGWERVEIDAAEASRLLRAPIADIGRLSGTDLRRLVQLADADAKTRTELAGEKKDELVTEAEALGIDSTGTKAELTERIAAAKLPPRSQQDQNTESAESDAAPTAGSSSEQPAAATTRRGR